MSRICATTITMSGRDQAIPPIGGSALRIDLPDRERERVEQVRQQARRARPDNRLHVTIAMKSHKHVVDELEPVRRTKTTRRR